MAEVRVSPSRQVVQPNRPTAAAQVQKSAKPIVEREKLVKVSTKKPLETTPGALPAPRQAQGQVQPPKRPPIVADAAKASASASE